MADANEQAWWRRTKALAVATLGGAGFVGFFLFVFYPFLDEVTLFSFPLGYFLAAVAFPAFLALIAIWYSRRQEDTDRRYGLFED